MLLVVEQHTAGVYPIKKSGMMVFRVLEHPFRHYIAHGLKLQVHIHPASGKNIMDCHIVQPTGLFIVISTTSTSKIFNVAWLLSMKSKYIFFWLR